MNAAKGIYNYKIYSNSFRYKPYQNNRILYNPNTDCGSSIVYINNYATAGLYNYTPYQPNKAALSNLYGTGDGCSAYGNRNFWTMYNHFFGSTTGISAPPARRITGPGSSSTTTEATASKVVSVRFKNTGTSNWYDIDSVPEGGSHLVLKATHVTGGESGFNEKFASPLRATQRFAAVYKSDGTKKTEDESNHIVTPGQTVQFDFTIASPSHLTNGEYRIAYRPMLASGATEKGYLSGTHTYYVRINNSLQATRITGPGSSSMTMKAGETKLASVQFKNTGSIPLYDIESMTEANPNVVLKATHVTGGESGFNAAFASSTRATQRFAEVYSSDGKPKTEDTNIVQPGETVRFAFTITAPSTLKKGTYRIAYQPIIPAGAEVGTRNLTWVQIFYVTID
jgi:hypothetical protein